MGGKIGIIGLGTIGAPIVYQLFKWDSNRMVVIASGVHRQHLEERPIFINGEEISPVIISDTEELGEELSLLIVCVKNFQLNDALVDICNVLNDHTIILPLENGIVAYNTLKKEFPNNVVLEGYIQGPNTVRKGNNFIFQHAGQMHIGSSDTKLCDCAIQSYLLLKEAKIDVIYEAEIRKMVWQKWMLNTAGNTVTALLGASYSDFKNSKPLQDICQKIMKEFLQVAHAENIYLDENDIEKVMDYFVTYEGEKATSMLDDINHHRMTENDYITGELIRIAKIHGIDVPVNETMYLLIKAKESLYC